MSSSVFVCCSGLGNLGGLGGLVAGTAIPIGLEAHMCCRTELQVFQRRIVYTKPENQAFCTNTVYTLVYKQLYSNNWYCSFLAMRRVLEGSWSPAGVRCGACVVLIFGYCFCVTGNSSVIVQSSSFRTRCTSEPGQL